MNYVTVVSGGLEDIYEEWMSLADKRVENWLLMKTPFPTLAWNAAYLLMVAIGLQGWLSFPRYRLRTVIILYNLFLIVLNGYIAVQLLTLSFQLNYSYSCQPVNYDVENQGETAMAKVLWWFYFSKLLEFFDTFLFIVRGNLRQVTFLHVYHHVSMFTLWWISIKWTAGGSFFFGPMTNSAVHVIMYGYYLICALFPGTLRRWKQLVTTLQMGQFVFNMLYYYRLLYIGCPLIRGLVWLLVVYVTSILFLFMHFFKRSYIDRNKASGASEHANSEVKKSKKKLA